MTTPRRRLLFHHWLQLALWLAIALVANHAGSTLFARFDLTRDQRFSLSQAARGAVADLERPLVVRVWFTADLEAPYHNHQDALLDKLEELRAWSGGRMKLSITDPTGDKEATEEARRFGIRPVTYTRRDWDRREARQVFMGASFVYGDRQAAVEALTSIERMEYEVVRAIRRVTVEPEDQRTVAYLQGDAEPDLAAFPADNPLGRLRDDLASEYRLIPVSLSGAPMPEDVDALLVIGPQLAIPEVARFHLDQFVMRGGAVAWFMSGVQPDFRTMKAQEVRHGLHPLLGHYGVRLNRDVVLDREQNEAMVVPVVGAGRQNLARVSYPLAVVTTRIDRIYGPVRSIERAVLPFTTTLGLVDPLPAGLQSEIWVHTGPTSVSSQALNSLRSDVLAQPAAGEVPGPFPAVVALSGRFPSFYAERAVPEGVGDAVDPEEVLSESEPTRMVVAASADMVANNLELVNNAVDWLLEDASLIAVRARAADAALLDVPDASAAWRWKAGIAGTPMALLCCLALVVWLRTRGGPP